MLFKDIHASYEPCCCDRDNDTYSAQLVYKVVAFFKLSKLITAFILGTLKR